MMYKTPAIHEMWVDGAAYAFLKFLERLITVGETSWST
jgi:hypothetical protein